MKKLIFLFLLSACSSHLPTNRSDYRLLNQDGFLISNIYVSPSQIYQDKNEIKIDYNIIVKNITKASRVINLDGAFIMIGIRTVPIACANKGGEPKFVIQPEQTLGVDCKVRLNKQEGVFQINDYKSMVEIPLDTTKARFAFLLRAEDFQ